MFTKFGSGRLNIDGHRRSSLCVGW